MTCFKDQTGPDHASFFHGLRAGREGGRWDGSQRPKKQIACVKMMCARIVVVVFGETEPSLWLSDFRHFRTVHFEPPLKGNTVYTVHLYL